MSPLSARLSTTFVSVAVTAACWASPSAAAIIASDVGTNPVYIAKQAYVGKNGGFGFGTWTAVSGSGTNQVDKKGLSMFNQTASAGNTYVIGRGIAVPLAVGDTLSLTIAGEEIKKTGGATSVLLYAAGTQVASLSYAYLGQTWRWNDGSGAVDTNVDYVRNANATITFTRTSSPAGYQFSLAQTGEPTFTTSGTITGGAATIAIDALRFSVTTGATPLGNLRYNTLQVQSVPEPSAIAMLATAAAGGLGVAHLRQRRRLLRAAARPAPLPLAV